MWLTTRIVQEFVVFIKSFVAPILSFNLNKIKTRNFSTVKYSSQNILRFRSSGIWRRQLVSRQLFHRNLLPPSSGCDTLRAEAASSSQALVLIRILYDVRLHLTVLIM